MHETERLRHVNKETISIMETFFPHDLSHEIPHAFGSIIKLICQLFLSSLLSPYTGMLSEATKSFTVYTQRHVSNASCDESFRYFLII